MAATEAQWDEVSFVISSRYRTIVMEHLGDVGPATPSKIATEHDVGIAHISRALQSLRDRDLVDLLVDENRKKGRIYGLTDDGETTRSLLEDYGGGA